MARLRAGWVLAALCLTLVAPLALTDVPPLLDYPNHLARVFVLHALPHDPVLARFYAAHWSVIPNLAVDLLGPPLLHMLPVHLAGRMLIALSVLLPVCGAVAYGRTIGSRWWPLGAGLVAYNATELHGFLNFSIAIGLALLLAAAWLRWRDHRPVLAAGLAMAGAPVLFLSHLMGLVFFGFLVIGAEVSAVRQSGSPCAALMRRAAVLGSVFAIPAVLYLSSDLRRLGGDAVFLAPGAKLAELLMPFGNYWNPIDWVTAVVAVGAAIRWGRMPGPAAISTVLLLAVFLAAPFAWKETFGLDARFAIMLGFMLFAGVVPRHMPVPIGAGLALLFLARMALLCVAWNANRQDLADLRTALAPVQPGQAVYVAEAGLTEATDYWDRRFRLLANGTRTGEHLPALIVIEHRAWWPFEFDTPSQQPVETLQPYRGMAERIGSLPDRAAAARADVCGFDYVLLTGADAVPDLPAIRFRKLVQAGYAALYAITKCKEEPS